MRRLLGSIVLAATLAFSVAGCATFEKASQVVTGVSAKQVVLGIQAFDAAKIGATGMLRLRVCSTAVKTFCRPRIDHPDMIVMIGAIDEGTGLRNELKGWVKANPNGLRDQSSYSALTAATTAIEKVLTAYQNVTR